MTRPEIINEIHNSNLIIHMDGKIKEVIDYLKMYDCGDLVSVEVIKTAIDKLDKI